jgi:beta-1,4-mannosyltransferase
VSAAMRETLGREWGLEGVVFRDRPAGTFRRLSAAERSVVRAGVFSRVGLASRSPQPLLVVSPTSWTADEDFDLLLEAARRLDAHFLGSGLDSRASPGTEAHRPVVVLLTGRGPLRAEYERRIAQLRLGSVVLSTAWLEPDEYPAVIAAADIGLCLHRSASGLDLPMKVMDFFGAGVPVCALDYGPCLAEAVRHGDNGLLFLDAPQLAADLARLASGALGEETAERLRAGAARAGSSTWEAGWTQDVLPVLSFRRPGRALRRRQTLP